jgi:hypothetical protein
MRDRSVDILNLNLKCQESKSFKAVTLIQITLSLFSYALDQRIPMKDDNVENKSSVTKRSSDEIQFVSKHAKKGIFMMQGNKRSHLYYVFQHTGIVSIGTGTGTKFQQQNL